MGRSTVVVIGAGVTGLVAALRLAADETHDVHLFEASDHLGGQIHAIAEPGSGLQIDVGAESVHLGAPHVAELVGELGLRDSLIAANPGASALLTKRGLVALPDGVGPTGPTRIAPVLRSGILSIKGLVRAGFEPITGRRKYPDDLSVGAFITRRFGREVADKFVDPLLGNLHSGNIHGLSIRSTAPQLLPTVHSGESLLLKAWRQRKNPPPAPTSGVPMFGSWAGGLTTMVDALATQSMAHIHLNSPVTSVTRNHDGSWSVTSPEQTLRADAVILAAPGRVASDLLGSIAPAVKVASDWTRVARVATIVLGFDKSEIAANRAMRDFNGILLNHHQSKTLKAMTNLSRKWSTLRDSESHIVRISVGRSTSSIVDSNDDQTLIDKVTHELSQLTKLRAKPVWSQVIRWSDGLPQLGMGHTGRVEDARTELATAAPGVFLAGATFDGLGIGNCVKSGNQAAQQASAFLESRR